MTKTPRRDLAAAFVRLLHTRTAKEAIHALAEIIIQEKRSEEIDFIVADIGKLLFREHQQLGAEVITARPLNSDFLQKIGVELKRWSGAKEVNLSPSIDPSIVGGAIIKTPEWELDLSIRRQLAALRR